MMRVRTLLISTCLVSSHIFAGCATTPRPYGSGGPGETWLIVDQQYTDADEVRASAIEQRGWGWETNYVTTSHDGGIKSFSAGPFAYAGDDPSSIQVGIWIFADQPMSGHVIFTATPEPDVTLQNNWDNPIIFPITMTEHWHSQTLILPQLQGPIQTGHIQWITDAPTDPASLDTRDKED